jgi:hypothetical protein
MKVRASLLIATAIVLWPNAGPPAAASADPLAPLAQRFVVESARRDPLFADGIGIHTYDDRLPDVSASGLRARRTWLRAMRNRIAVAAAATTGLAQRADARALQDAIDLELFENATIRPYRTDPTTYTQLLGNAVYQLTSRTFALEHIRLRNVAARLGRFPTIVDAACANLGRPSRVATLQAIDENRGTVAMVTALPATDGIARTRPVALRALRRFDAFLSGPLLARSDGSARAGAVVYDRELQLDEGTDETRASLVRRARAAFDATRARMLTLALPLDRTLFPNALADETKPNAVDVVVHRVLDRLAQDHPGRDTIFASARDDVAAARRFVIARNLLALPEPDTLHVAPTPPFMAGTSGAMFDGPGPFAPLGQAYYYIDTIPRTWTADQVGSYLRDNNTYEMKMLSLHEAMPGHYVQTRYNNTSPSLVRRVYANGSFVEGWAVYVEGMMVDTGYGEGDPRLKLFQLKWRLREEANALIDAGFHAGAMTRPQVEDLLVRQAYQERAQTDEKWHRLQLTHNQLSSYFVGLDALSRARDAMRAKLGPRFDVRRFNEALLATGSVEPRFVEPLVAQKLGVK